MLRAYARREAEIDRVTLAGFVLGLSTRKVGETLLAILGQKISASTVSRVAKTLDAAVAAFHRRPLKDRYEVLMLDGVVLARKTGAGALRVRKALEIVQINNRFADRPIVRRRLHRVLRKPNQRITTDSAPQPFVTHFFTRLPCIRHKLLL